MRQGFTLIELIVVVVIIAVLTSLALPQYNKTTERSRQAESFTVLGSIRGAQLRYYVENGVYTAIVVNLDIDLPDYDSNGVPGDGKYFTYTLSAPTATNLARAARNTVSRTAGIPGYTLRITREGIIRCVTTGAGDCVSVPP